MFKDKNGNKISLEQFADYMEDTNDYKKVKRELIGDYFISTVWLGVEHFNGMYFETMVFLKSDIENGNWGDIEMFRYATLQEAIAGHEEVTNKYRNPNEKI
jgi:hypothetical protein